MSVLLTYIHNGDVKEAFMQSILKLIKYDREGSNLIKDVLGFGGNCIPAQRNEAVRAFLASNCDYQWFVDSDMVFNPDCLDKLITSVNNINQPIISALCFSWLRREEKKVLLAPNWYKFNNEGLLKVLEEPLCGIQKLDAVGTGCVLIHRTVLEAIEQVYVGNNWCWFDNDSIKTGNEYIKYGEDVSFCFRATKLGFPIYGDEKIRVGHLKIRCENLTTFKEQQALKKLWI